MSQLLWTTFKETKSPVILIGLFPYEHKMSVLNVVLKRTPNYDIPIESKERLIIQCGYRRFIVNPIFSQHTNGTKHKVCNLKIECLGELLIYFVAVRTILSTRFCNSSNLLCSNSVSTSTRFMLQGSE